MTPDHLRVLEDRLIAAFTDESVSADEYVTMAHEVVRARADHLRAAIERIGIEKDSDYTLVMEEVGRMEAEEKLVERVARAIFATDWPRDDWDRFGPKDNATERYRAMARTAVALVKAVREVKG